MASTIDTGGSPAPFSKTDANGDPVLIVVKIGTSLLIAPSSEPPQSAGHPDLRLLPPSVSTTTAKPMMTEGLADHCTAVFCATAIQKLAGCICTLRHMGYQVLLVTSGAVGAGCVHLGMTHRPSNITAKQAAAAVGQCRLMVRR
eukprot:GHVU01074615.1.p1 GENE.GHVU01074615.1~~GHVU01074615.1.p1  ORF type:complete len:144 (-),score=11.87 GHVU01074615.1:67-498(-)